MLQPTSERPRQVSDDGTVPVQVRAGQSVATNGSGSVLHVPFADAERFLDMGIAVPAFVEPPDWSRVPKGPEFCGPATVRCATATCPKKYEITRAPCCKAIVTELVRYIGGMLDRFRVTWWADYGTLLGAVRHGGMIPWDKDADLGIPATEMNRVLTMEHAILAAGLGFHFSRRETIKIRCSKLNHTNVDIFPWYRRLNGRMYRKAYASVDRFKGREFKADLLFPLRRIPYEDTEVWAPHDPEAFLAMRYGPNWRTPVHANNDRVRR